jgi:multidrug efflux pump subunit AcrB
MNRMRLISRWSGSPNRRLWTCQQADARCRAIAILTVIVGAVVIAGLPVAHFPAIAPPEIQIYATYVGADAQTIEQSVATPIEQQMSGVDNMNYMSSLNDAANGQMRMRVNFDVASDPNTDFILSQSRVTQEPSQLQVDVTNYGVTVQTSVLAPLMLIALSSPTNSHDSRFLANYAYINLTDQLTTVKGVGRVTVFGAGQYAMRLWVRPDQLAKLQITVSDIVTAIQASLSGRSPHASSGQARAADFINPHFRRPGLLVDAPTTVVQARTLVKWVGLTPEDSNEDRVPY